MHTEAIEVPIFLGRRAGEPPFEADVTGDESLSYQLQMQQRRKMGLSQIKLPSLLKEAAKTLQSGFGSAVLNHNLVPFRRMPTFLRLVDTLAEVLDYSAGGFHVAVARGLVGGASDSSVSFGKALLTGQRPIVPQNPLKRTDLVEKWKAAAGAYKAVFDQANAGPGFFLPLVDKLREANALADAAYQAEDVAPPKDPGPGTTEVPSEPKEGVVKRSNRGLYMAGLAVAGIVGFFAFRPTAADSGF